MSLITLTDELVNGTMRISETWYTNGHWLAPRSMFHGGAVLDAKVLKALHPLWNPTESQDIAMVRAFPKIRDTLYRWTPWRIHDWKTPSVLFTTDDGHYQLINAFYVDTFNLLEVWGNPSRTQIAVANVADGTPTITIAAIRPGATRFPRLFIDSSKEPTSFDAHERRVIRETVSSYLCQLPPKRDMPEMRRILEKLLAFHGEEQRP